MAQKGMEGKRKMDSMKASRAGVTGKRKMRRRVVADVVVTRVNALLTSTTWRFWETLIFEMILTDLDIFIAVYFCTSNRMMKLDLI